MCGFWTGAILLAQKREKGACMQLCGALNSQHHFKGVSACPLSLLPAPWALTMQHVVWLSAGTTPPNTLRS